MAWPTTANFKLKYLKYKRIWCIALKLSRSPYDTLISLAWNSHGTDREIFSITKFRKILCNCNVILKILAPRFASSNLRCSRRVMNDHDLPTVAAQRSCFHFISCCTCYKICAHASAWSDHSTFSSVVALLRASCVHLVVNWSFRIRLTRSSWTVYSSTAVCICK